MAQADTRASHKPDMDSREGSNQGWHTTPLPPTVERFGLAMVTGTTSCDTVRHARTGGEHRTRVRTALAQ